MQTYALISRLFEYRKQQRKINSAPTSENTHRKAKKAVVQTKECKSTLSSAILSIPKTCHLHQARKRFPRHKQATISAKSGWLFVLSSSSPRPYHRRRPIARSIAAGCGTPSATSLGFGSAHEPSQRPRLILPGRKAGGKPRLTMEIPSPPPSESDGHLGDAKKNKKNKRPQLPNPQHPPILRRISSCVDDIPGLLTSDSNNTKTRR